MVRNLPANAGEVRVRGSTPGLGKSPGVGNGCPLVFLHGKFHGQRRLVGIVPGSPRTGHDQATEHKETREIPERVINRAYQSTTLCDQKGGNKNAN